MTKLALIDFLNSLTPDDTIVNRINMIRLRVLNDTQMYTLDTKQQKIVALFLEKGELQSFDVHADGK